MELNSGDKVYIEALTGTTANNGNWSIKGRYEIDHETEKSIFLKEDGLPKPLKIFKDRIIKIRKTK